MFFLTAVMAWGAVKEEWVVKDGDTLGGIIWTLRAQGISVTRIGEWNPKLGTRVVVGQKIAYYLPDAPIPQISKAEMEQAIRITLDEIRNRDKETDRQRTDEARRERNRFAFAGLGLLSLLMIAFGGLRW